MTFEDGAAGIVAFERYLEKGGAFNKFKDIDFFKNFSINEELGVLVCEDEIDIALKHFITILPFCSSVSFKATCTAVMPPPMTAVRSAVFKVRRSKSGENRCWTSAPCRYSDRAHAGQSGCPPSPIASNTLRVFNVPAVVSTRIEDRFFRRAFTRPLSLSASKRRV